MNDLDRLTRQLIADTERNLTTRTVISERPKFRLFGRKAKG